MGGDSRMASVGGLWVGSGGSTIEVLLRRVELNRAGLASAHPITTAPAELLDVDAVVARDTDFGMLRIGVGYADRTSGTVHDGARGFLEWHAQF
jgi:hypothetical protein